MPTFAVNFSVDRNYEVLVEAINEEEAQRLVEDGDIDLDESDFLDSALLEVNNVEEVDGEEAKMAEAERLTDAIESR